MPAQCPKCELRFAVDGELDDHLVRDHGVDPLRLPDVRPSGRFARDTREATTRPPSH